MVTKPLSATTSSSLDGSIGGGSDSAGGDDARGGDARSGDIGDGRSAGAGSEISYATSSSGSCSMGAFEEGTSSRVEGMKMRHPGKLMHFYCREFRSDSQLWIEYVA